MPGIEEISRDKIVDTFWHRLNKNYYYSRFNIDGDVYMGNESIDKKKNGKGALINKNNKMIYDGYWKNDIKDGTGVLYNQNNRKMIYQGKWKNDLPNGYGMSFNKDEFLEYEGNFKDSLYHGKGKLLDAKGHSIYSGEFMNGYYHGEGIQYNTSTAFIKTVGNDQTKGTYYGQFEDGKKTSYGKFITNDFDKKYAGAWNNDVEHGEGKFYERNKGLSYSNYCSKFKGCFMALYEATAKRYYHMLDTSCLNCFCKLINKFYELLKDHLSSCFLWEKLGGNVFKHTLKIAKKGVKKVWKCINKGVFKSYGNYNDRLKKANEDCCCLCPCLWLPLFILGAALIGPIWILCVMSIIFPLIFGLIAIVLFLPFFLIAYIMYTLFCMLVIMFTSMAMGFVSFPLLFIYLFLGIVGIFIGFPMVLPGPIFVCIKGCKCNEWKLAHDGRWRFGEHL